MGTFDNAIMLIVLAALSLIFAKNSTLLSGCRGDRLVCVCINTDTAAALILTFAADYIFSGQTSPSPLRLLS